MGIDASAVARGVGVTTNFKDLSGGSTRFVPQRIAIIAPGEDGVSYSTDKLTLDNGAAQAGSVYGYKSPVYHIARELYPTLGQGIGTVIVDVIALANPSGGAAAVGVIDVTAGTATETASYYPTLGGVRGLPVTVPKGVIDESVALSDAADSVNSTIGMPAAAALTYGTVVGADSANIALTVLSVSGSPKGGDYALECTDAGSQLFSLIDPKGSVRAQNLAVGANDEDGIAFTITATVATLGETATITVPATDVQLTAGWKGASGNSVELEMVGPTNLGVVWALTPFAGGAGETAVDDALVQIGDAWTTIIVTTEKSTTQLDKFSAWGEGRWGELVHKPCVAFYGANDRTVGNATFVTQGRTSDRVTCQLVAPDSKKMPWVIAAAEVNRIASLAQKNPAHDYGSQACFSLTPGEDQYQWNYAQRDQAIKGGSSTVEVKGGVVHISDVVTPWSPTGEEPPAYRYVVDIMKIMQVIHNVDLAFNNSEWDGAPLISEGPTTNPAAKTPKMAIAKMAGVADNLGLAAIITNVDAAKESITANINPSNPKRLDVTMTVQVSGNTNIRDVTLNWGFFFGSAPVVG